MKMHMAVIALLCAAAAVSQAQESAPMRLIQTITLPVTGQFDHMAVDPRKDRAFVAASTHGSIEVLDLRAGKWIKSIPGPGKPAGVIYSVGIDRIVYSTDSGDLRILNPNTLEIEKDLKLAVDADSMGLDVDAQVVYVDNGGRAMKEDYSRVSPVDLRTRRNLGDIRIEGGRLEALAFQEKGPLMFVNDTSLNKVVVIDRNRRKVVGNWDISSVAKDNVPMALNEADHRLYVGTRQPGMLVVLDSKTGKVVAHLPATGDTDGLYFDSARKRIYSSGGDGFVDVYQEKDPNSYIQIAKIPTRKGARTSRWVPEQNRLYVELPAIKAGEAAEVQVFEAGK